MNTRITLLLCLLPWKAYFASAQHKPDSGILVNKDLIGVWQRDSKRVGNGLEQNFRFFADGTFALYFHNSNEDLRVIRALAGRYRLVDDKLFLTIIYRTVIEGGHIETSGSNEDFYNFGIAGGIVKDIRESDPKELPDPLYISRKEEGHIEIGNEDYYRIGKEDLASIEPGIPDTTALPVLSYDSIETLVKGIRLRADRIDKDSAAFRIVRQAKESKSGETIDLRKYYSGDTLCKAMSFSLRQSALSVKEYYFKDGMLIFVLEDRTLYSRGATAQGHSVSKVLKLRYYFAGQHLIRAVFDEQIVQKRLYPQFEEMILKEVKSIIAGDK